MLSPVFLALAISATAVSRVKHHMQVKNDLELSAFMNNGFMELLRERDSANFGKFPGDNDDAPMGFKDHNGHQCDICGKPLASRLKKGKVYKEFRNDCGQQKRSTWMVLFTKLNSFNKKANETENGLPMDAFCVLNAQKSCTDAIANKDYMYYAKSIRGLEGSQAKKYDWSYCKENGWLEKDIVDLAHSGDFDAMQRKGNELCETKYMKYNWKKMTLAQMAMKYVPGIAFRGHATNHEANYLGAWNCAMGDAACDMTYCAYSYCDLGDDVPRLYSECPGWTALKGNRK